MKEFTRWVAGMHAKPSAELVGLYQRAVVCQRFPAYKLHELRGTPALEVLRAIKLLGIVDQLRE